MTTPAAEASELNTAGCTAFNEGHAQQALELLQRAAHHAPNDLGIQVNLLRCQWANGQVEAAYRRAAYWATRAKQAQAWGQELRQVSLRHVRAPAIAGQFYPGPAAQLQSHVEQYLRQSAALTRTETAPPKVLVVPHAGYRYSGAIAAAAYARVRPFAEHIRRVILLGPAHRVSVQGIALPGVGAYRSPLGDVVIDSLALEAIRDLPFITTQPEAHAPEHCLEVQLPFLQCSLPQFSLVPLLVGRASTEQVLQVIERLWYGPQTLFVISTDLSHYHPYEAAQRMDSDTCQRIMSLQPSLDGQHACGARPLNGMLQWARQQGLRIEALARCNSGDTVGDKARVVGYASFALYAATEAPDTQAASGLSAEQGQQLLNLAQHTLQAALRQQPLPEVAAFSMPGASFVTLTKAGCLRGCIGSLHAHRPLGQDVMANTVAAALRDPRFEPVALHELPDLAVEVSVLMAPQPLPCANESHAIYQLQAGVDGVIFECGSHRSTFLPQVWQKLPEPRAFLAHLKVKAGLPFDYWPDKNDPHQVTLQRYHAQKLGPR